MRFFWGFVLVLVLSSKVSSQIINNITVSSDTFCVQSIVTVTFDVLGSFNNGNTFVAQISDGNGSFNTFSTIGNGLNSPITCTIPARANSSLYRIRVISSSPLVIGSDNGKNLLLSNPPIPSYSILKKSEYFPRDILLGDTVYVRNTTPGASACRWNFGAGAEPQTFEGCTPPAVKYNSIGRKHISLSLKVGACAATFNNTSPSISVYTCKPLIPATAHVIKPGENFNFNDSEPVWVCPGADFNKNSYIPINVYVEPGGNVSNNYIGPIAAFLKDGSSADLKYNYGVAISSGGASITGLVPTKLNCLTIEFDYSNFPCGGGCLPLGCTGAEDKTIDFSIKLFPNPSKGIFELEANYDIDRISFYNLLGEKLRNISVSSSKSIDLLEFQEGIYFAEFFGGNKRFVQRISIEK